MIFAARALAAIFLSLCCALPARAADRAPLERGTAIIDPLALRELDQGRFGLTRIMIPARSANIPLTNAELFALPAMEPVKKALDADFERYVERHKAELPNERIGVGPDFAFQLFDRAQLYSSDTRFVLSGIVNRMDRAYVAPESCGEVRLLYRLTQTNAQAVGEAAVTPRLPMTLNVVLKARGDHALADGKPITCAEVAKRWLTAGGLTVTGKDLVLKLFAPDGALVALTPENIVRIETNLQIAHAPKSAARDFRTDYAMRVFDHDAASATFVASPLENQIDRDRLLADKDLGRD